MSVNFTSLNNRPFDVNASSSEAPASVRYYNIGAIGASRAGHELRFGAMNAKDLPGSNGKPLSTPVFSTIYGGAAYFGHYVVRRAYFENRDDMSWSVTLRDIFKKYQTGSSDQYMNTVSSDTGIGVDEAIDFLGAKDADGPLKLYRVMVAMGRWEANARKETSKHFEAFNRTYQVNQSLVDELWWGMRHGVWEAVRDAGYNIDWQSTETYFDANTGQPLNVKTPEPMPVKKEELTKGDELVERLMDGDQALTGKLSGFRSMIFGGLGVVTNWINNSLVATGVISENVAVWLTGLVWVLVAAFGFFMVMKFMKFFMAYLNRKVK
jgi:hypothetical protein